MYELSDEDYEEIDPGIRETVRFLRGHGFDTTDSGDGKTKFPDGPDAPGMPCAMPVANVAILVEPEQLVAEADRLCALLQSVGVVVGAITGNIDEDEHTIEIQAGYDPYDGSSVIVVMFLDDAKLARARTFS
jgi:hypothetical protein